MFFKVIGKLPKLGDALSMILNNVSDFGSDNNTIEILNWLENHGADISILSYNDSDLKEIIDDLIREGEETEIINWLKERL
jgi:hypothetical protein